MKRKLSLLFTLALSIFVTAGCDLSEYVPFLPNDNPEQKEEDKHDEQKEEDKEQQPEDKDPNPEDDEGQEQEENFVVSFNANGGIGTMQDQTTKGSTFIVPACSFTNDGFIFKNWALNSVDGKEYAVGSKIEYISGNIALFALWANKSTITYIDDDYGNYYSSISDDLTGDDLLDALNELNNEKRVRTMTYNGLKYYGQYTEIDWTGKDNVENKMFGFYDNALICSTWDNQATWNREHVWPKSLGGSKVEGDMFMPRPCSVKINSDRGNMFYGLSNTNYDPGQFEVNYRGVAARIIFYCAIADKTLDIIDDTSGGNNEMGKLSELLKWNLEYLPDRSSNAHLTLRIEQNRNKVMYTREDLQKNRNPFVDHPEYACRIWGNRNAATKSICGGN